MLRSSKKQNKFASINKASYRTRTHARRHKQTRVYAATDDDDDDDDDETMCVARGEETGRKNRASKNKSSLTKTHYLESTLGGRTREEVITRWW